MAKQVIVEVCMDAASEAYVRTFYSGIATKVTGFTGVSVCDARTRSGGQQVVAGAAGGAASDAGDIRVLVVEIA